MIHKKLINNLFKATQGQVSLRIKQTGIRTHIIDNFAGHYNHCVKCFNSSAFEINYEDEPEKKTLRGSRFFFQNFVVSIYIVLFLIACLIWENNTLFTGILLAICLIYWLLIFYNIYVIYSNGNIIAKNFIYSKELCNDYVNEFYDIELSGIQQNAALATNLSSLMIILQQKSIYHKIKVMSYHSVYLSRTKPSGFLIIHAIFNLIIIICLCDFISKS